MSPPGALGSLRGALARLRGEERGLTVVEGVVAALVLVLGALGVLQVFDASIRTNFRAEQSQVVNNRLQAELEAIRQLPYAKIALERPPDVSPEENSPLSRVQGPTFAVDRAGIDYRQLVVNGGAVPDSEDTVSGGEVDPGPEEFSTSTGDVSGEIYRFVTWTSDPDCAECGEGLMKRVVVAAKVDVDDVAVSFDRRYQELQTDVADPEAAPDEDPAPPGEGEEGNTAEFWITDTTCDNDQRLPIIEDHEAHNTRGLCSAGTETGVDSDPGAPDLMFVEAPAIDEAFPPTAQPLFDYSSDLGGSADGAGLTMPWTPADQCLLEPPLGLVDVLKMVDGAVPAVVGEPDELDGLLDLPDRQGSHHQVHKWVSPKVGSEGGVLAGEGNLDLWTRTVNGAVYQGEVCVTLFTRQTVQVPVLPEEVEVCAQVLDELGDPETVCETVEVDLGLVDLDSSPPTLCVTILGENACTEVPLDQVDLEVDVPLLNVGLLSNQGGFICQQGLNLTYFRCSMNPWPSAWTRLSIPMKFVGIDSAGEVVSMTLPPQSRVGLSLMVKKEAGQGGDGLEFMYDHVDFESRLQLKTEALIPFQGS